MKTILAGVFLFLAADVISDDQCKPWEHWEGAHDGRCACACSVVGEPGTSDGLALGLSAGFIGIVIARRRR